MKCISVYVLYIYTNILIINIIYIYYTYEYIHMLYILYYNDGSPNSRDWLSCQLTGGSGVRVKGRGKSYFLARADGVAVPRPWAVRGGPCFGGSLHLDTVLRHL